MSCQEALKSVCKRIAPRGASREEEEEWTKKMPTSYLQTYEEGEFNLSLRYRSSSIGRKNTRLEQEKQTGDRDCKSKQVWGILFVCFFSNEVFTGFPTSETGQV